MGLDSVELLVEVEKFFDIIISNQEAEQIYTVEDFAKIISKHISFHRKEITVFDEMRLKLEDFFLGKFNVKINTESLLEDLLPLSDRQQIWDDLALYLDLSLLQLNKPDLTGNYRPKNVKFLGITINTIFEKKPLLKDKTVTNLVDWIISLNYRKVFNPLIINDLYGIQRIIVGITSEKSGVDINDIEVSHSFTNDLGID